MKVYTVHEILESTKKKLAEVIAERDALLSELHKANSTIIDLQRIPPKFSSEYIAEIRAEAGRAGYLAATYDYEVLFEIECKLTPEQAADEYAAKLRQGGV